MSEIKILVEGYAREGEEGESASSTATLIRDSGLNIVVDPGMDRQGLLAGLASEGLSTEQIDFVVLTHTHLDHSLLAGIFENARVLDNDLVYSFEGKITEHGGKVPNTDIGILSTPGHDPFHCSVLVETGNLGKVVVAGDVFWWRDNEEQNTDKESLLAKQDPYMKNKEQLLASRQKVLEIADYIIPGHGKMFKAPK